MQTTETFTYDAVGNRLTGPGYAKANTFTQNYQYDYENRITSITKQVTGDPNTDTVIFKYDPFGRRIEKNVSTYEGGIPTTYKYTYVYDNEDIILEIEEKTQNGTTITTTTAYIHGPGIDEPLMLERGGQRYYYHADGLGSITSITDANQAVVNRYAYDSFGAIKKSETIRNAYAFTGREFDSETGLYYYRARYYDPEVGRFVSKDPIGFAGGDVNVFGYVQNNPINYSDPTGLICFNFDKFAKEVEDNRFNIEATLGTLASALGFGTMPKVPSELRSFGQTKGEINPITNQLSRWSGRFGTRVFREIGRSVYGIAVGTAATSALVFEGFYDLSVIAGAASNATSLDDCSCNR